MTIDNSEQPVKAFKTPQDEEWRPLEVKIEDEDQQKVQHKTTLVLPHRRPGDKQQCSQQRPVDIAQFCRCHEEHRCRGNPRSQATVLPILIPRQREQDKTEPEK